MTEQRPGSDPRPEDVDTGFWLWAVALPLLVAGYLLDAVTAAAGEQRALTIVLAVVFMIVVSSIVVAFLILMRQGYRWTRTVLTSGGLVSVIHVATSLFTGDRPPAAAVGYALTGICGSVLIAGGVYLLHRKDANGFFTR
ncbi:membrane protein [Mycolicibacterium goodii]|uniref:Membrane protein n=2 Tax=Mycolicibacterium goodii TaxID=134601 RepID=A0A0K0XF06_MYCGD|nr:membrane protein [Mycolicibacterium goodii]